MADNEKTVLTKEGYDKLNAELRHLIDVIRPEVIEQLAFARSLGDLSENADYDAAKSRQADVEQRVRQLEDILANAVIMEENTSNTKTVGFGKTVTIKFLNNQKTVTYKIVGTHETNVFSNQVSNVSPIGEALMGSKVNDKVTVKAPKPYQVQILKIE
jgi:transcription elongation factor GreA